MNTNYYRNENWVDNTFSKRGKMVLSLLAVIFSVGIIAGGCGFLQNVSFGGANNAEESQVPAVESNAAPVADVAVTPDAAVKDNEKSKDTAKESKEIEVDAEQASSLVSYDVTSIGRSDPFMPYDEIRAFDEARASAIEQANAHNAKIAEIEKLKDVSIRELDDISPYSFNLPVPPTALAPSEAAAAKITRTKVVGIMYNQTSPSAIINVDKKDYLVRTGDLIIGEKYKVLQINQSWITVGLGSNIYSASIGELFSKDDFTKTQNDLYNLKSRFGGRKS